MFDYQQSDEVAIDISATGEVIDDTAAPFFAPVSSDCIDALLGQYRITRQRIEEISEIVTGAMYAGPVTYFLTAARRESYQMPSAVDRLFAKEGAIAALNADYWERALALTDVYSAMPQKRREEWDKSIREHKTPDFNEDAVRPTIQDLLASRNKFFCERIDGLFRALSGEHVTNVPEGFSKRMIIAYLLNDYGGHASERVGYINDLRCIIAKFMGREDQPKWNATNAVVNAARRNRGQWITIDGGALRLRVYLKGTAHLEVHPMMAYRLNQVLGSMYPYAIPAEFRAKPKKTPKDFVMMGRPLPFAVLEVIGGLRKTHESPMVFELPYGIDNKQALAEALLVLSALGGCQRQDEKRIINFDYPAQDVLDEVVASGCIPDTKAHQFYATPASIAAVAVEMANIGETDYVLEPSAGNGALADFLPNARTQCVEISPLRCEILKAKGYNVEQADFIEWAKTAPLFDRIVMNPPYSEGRWNNHLAAAAGLLKNGGILVAVLPASAHGKMLLAGFETTWSTGYANEFAGTSMAVAIMAVRRSE